MKVLPPVVFDEDDAGFKNSSAEVGGGGANSAFDALGSLNFSRFEASSLGGEKSFLFAVVLSAIEEIPAKDSFRRPGDLGEAVDIKAESKDCLFLGEM